MVDGLELNYVNAYNELLNNVSSELSKKIKEKKLYHNDIAAIARSVIIEENDNGIVSVSKRGNISRNIDVQNNQLVLIRKICSQNIEEPINSNEKKRKFDSSQEIDISAKKQELLQDNVLIARNRKRKAKDEPDSDFSTFSKERKLEKISEPTTNDIKDFFSNENGLSVDILGIITDYLDETLRVIIDLAYDKKEFPDHLMKNIKILNLSDYSKYWLDIDTFSHIVKNFKNLKSLTLPKHATDEWLVKLSNENLPNLTTLNLSWCEKISDLSSLNSLQSLTDLNLLYCSGIHDFSPLKDLRSLTHLNLSHICFNYLSYLAELKSLTHLELECTDISDISLLKNLTSLTNLNLGLCTSVNDFSTLETLNSLKILDLSSTTVSDLSILKALPSLTSLELSHCHNIIDIGPLAAIKSLAHLDLSWCVNLEDISTLENLPLLTYLNLSYDKLISNFDVLKTLKSLIILRLDNCDISDTGVQNLESLTSLKELFLNNNGRISDISSLAKLIHLERLHLASCNNITDTSSLKSLANLKIFYKDF